MNYHQEELLAVDVINEVFIFNGPLQLATTSCCIINDDDDGHLYATKGIQLLSVLKKKWDG